MKKPFLRGDTLVEVMLSVGIFGIVAVSAISLMNRGLNTAQTALETTMARNEIDAQAEALRFIHDAYVAETDSKTKEYADLWNTITRYAYSPTNNSVKQGSNFMKYPSSVSSCNDVYNDSNSIGIVENSFVINTHALSPPIDATKIEEKQFIKKSLNSSNKILYASTYPRLIFNAGDNSDINNSDYGISTLSRAEGIWVTAVKSEALLNNGTSTKPQYYDFYIRTCWDSVGRGTPVTISTTIRLYNPND